MIIAFLIFILRGHWLFFKVLMHFIGDEEESENDDSSTDMESSNSLRVRTLHISSPILVAQSQFSYKVISL